MSQTHRVTVTLTLTRFGLLLSGLFSQCSALSQFTITITMPQRGDRNHPVHKYFTENKSNNTSQCNDCKIVLKSINSSNLIKHLNSNHAAASKTLCAEIQQYKKRPEDPVPTPSAAQVPFSFDLKWANSDPRYLKVKKSVVDMIIIDSLPFTFVENDGFRKLMNTIQPKFSLPKRDSIRDSVIKRCVEIENCNVEKIIKEALSLSLSTDLWSNKKITPFIGVTVTFIDQKYTVQNSVLEIAHFEHPHTGVRIREKFDECIKQLNLSSLPFVPFVCTDSASNNKVAFADGMEREEEADDEEYSVLKVIAEVLEEFIEERDSDCSIKWTPCIDHLLHLATTDITANSDLIKKVVS